MKELNRKEHDPKCGGSVDSLEDGILLSGGLFLTRPVVEPKLERIPSEGFLTVSKCLADFVPDDWVYWNATTRKSEREERAASLGIEAGKLDDLTTWCNEEFSRKHSIGYPNVIYTIQTAQELVKLLGPISAKALSLLGIGVGSNRARKLLGFAEKAAHSSPHPPLVLGVPFALQKGLGLPDGGELLGFDALGYEKEGTFHSSKCYETKDPEIEGIHFNHSGYCSNIGDARLLCDIHSAGTNDSIFWLPVEIRRYELRWSVASR